jgi:hypothetical protein
MEIKNDLIRIRCSTEQKQRIVNNALQKGYSKGKLSEFVLTRLLDPDIPQQLLLKKIVDDIAELKIKVNGGFKNGRY